MTDEEIHRAVIEDQRRHGGSAAGMSLRDWFAGQALVGFIAKTGANAAAVALLNAADESGHSPETELAMMAYGTADAMLAERSK